MAGPVWGDADDVEAVAWLVRGGWVSGCLRAMADLGLADALAAPLTVEELASSTATRPDALLRLLRALADIGLVEPDGPERYRLTARGELLRRDHPADLRSLALMQTWAPNLTAWSQLSTAVASGEGTFEAANGATVWRTLSRHPGQQAVFNAAMARRGSHQAQTIRDACDLADVGTVVDVGGGRGAMLAALLTAEPRLRGVLADRPDVVAEARETFEKAGVTDRCDIREADFFVGVPAGGDAYVLSNILHDWTDDQCLQILQTVRAAMPPGSRLWVLERVLDPEPPRSPDVQAELHLLDLNMLVLFGARERTRAEYATLLTRAGFLPPRVHSPSGQLDVVEAVSS
jgi:hypothetical protein